jgi:hypothetical protein
MIHLIAGRKRGVEIERAEAEDATRLGRYWRHLPSRGGHEAGDSRAGCAGVRGHVGWGRVGEHENGAGETRHRWNASSWIGIASGSP